MDGRRSLPPRHLTGRASRYGYLDRPVYAPLFPWRMTLIFTTQAYACMTRPWSRFGPDAMGRWSGRALRIRISPKHHHQQSTSYQGRRLLHSCPGYAHPPPPFDSLPSAPPQHRSRCNPKPPPKSERVSEARQQTTTHWSASMLGCRPSGMTRRLSPHDVR